MSNDNQPSTISDYRRKRVNKLKKIILITALILILIPLILCVILLIKVHSMQKTIDELLVLREEDAIVALQDDNGRVYYMYASAIEAMVEEYDSGAMAVKPQVNETETSSQETGKDGTDKETEDNEPETVPVVQEPSKETASESEDTEQIDTGRYVYLTFDDGPSVQTDKILKILDEHNVTATFFVVGLDDEESAARYKAIVDSGNSIGLHSYSHNYKKIYVNVDSFAQDIQQISDLVYKATGVRSKLYRFPGGSSNSVAGNIDIFIEYLNQNGYTYYDWNSSSRDAAVVLPTKDEIINTVISEVQGRDNVVVLMHDSEKKATTVEALPELIERLKAMGYTIKGIDESSEPVQHR